MRKQFLITETRLRELLEAEARLEALEYGGVDNWEWCDDSLHNWLKEFKEWNNIQNKDIDFEDVVDLGITEFIEFYIQREEDDEWCE